MNLYFYKSRIDLAATSLVDLQAMIGALADESIPANAAIIANVTSKVQALVQADTGEPLSLWFYDNATTPSSWVADAGVTLWVGLGLPNPSGGDSYASTSTTAISGTGRTASLALNTVALSDALRRVIACKPLPAGCFTLQLRKTEGGVTETVGLISIEVWAGVLSQAQTSGTVSAAVLPGVIVPRPDITALTGSTSTSLDSIATANGAAATGATVLLSYGRIPQTWQLMVGTDAENVNATPAIVRPDDYDAATNARVWVQLS